MLTHHFSSTARGEVKLLLVSILFQGQFLHFTQYLFNISFTRDDGRKDESQHSVSVPTIRLYNISPSCLFFFYRNVPKSWEIQVQTTSDCGGKCLLHLPVLFTQRYYTEVYGPGVLHFRIKTGIVKSSIVVEHCHVTVQQMSHVLKWDPPTYFLGLLMAFLPHCWTHQTLLQLCCSSWKTLKGEERVGLRSHKHQVLAEHWVSS